MDKAVGIET